MEYVLVQKANSSLKERFALIPHDLNQCHLFSLEKITLLEWSTGYLINKDTSTKHHSLAMKTIDGRGIRILYCPEIILPRDYEYEEVDLGICRMQSGIL